MNKIFAVMAILAFSFVVGCGEDKPAGSAKPPTSGTAVTHSTVTTPTGSTETHTSAKDTK